MRYFIDENKTLYSGDEFAEFSENAKEITEKEYEKIISDGEKQWAEYIAEAAELAKKAIQERYDRLVRNGWNKKDALVESGLDQYEKVK